MTPTYIFLLIVVFLLGFQIGKAYIIKGLTLRVEQLYQEDDNQKAQLFERALEEHENTKG